jgi:hypothetical protein
MKTYQKLATTIDALINCIEKGNAQWQENHETTIEKIMERAPHGSGFDSGTKIDLKNSTGEKIIFTTSFHHMNDGGYYDGWTEHTITVRPSMRFGFTMTISGRDRNDTKDFISECFESFLSEPIENEYPINSAHYLSCATFYNPETAAKCLHDICAEWFLAGDTIDINKPLSADTISAVTTILQKYGFYPKT